MSSPGVWRRDASTQHGEYSEPDDDLLDAMERICASYLPKSLNVPSLLSHTPSLR
jgi:hypothetical protein